MIGADQLLPLKETIAPADEAGVADCLRRAAAEKTPVYPIGGRAGLGFGARPAQAGIGLALRNLRGVVDYPADDMTITVEAGMTLAELTRRLAEKRQRLPVDIPQPLRATIGGAVAVNPSGPRRYGCGTLRDYVLGLRAVDGQGMVFSAGGRVVKNAAGYNLCRLLVGSLGTLGVITQVTLMVRPMPETSAFLACDLPDFDVAERLLAGLVHTPTLPAAIELLCGPACRQMPVLEPLREAHAARLIVGFEGSTPEVQWMVGQLQAEWRELGTHSPATVDSTAAGPLWDWLTEWAADLQIYLLPSQTVPLLAQLSQMEPGISLQAHAGNGVIRLRLPPLPPQRFAAVVRQQLRPAVAEAGGRMVLLAAPAEAALTARDLWGPPGEGAVVMQAIKDRFDPLGILNPGRYGYSVGYASA